MILEINCRSLMMNNVLYAVKNILNTLLIIAPILAIIAGVIALIRLLNNPEDKKGHSRIINIIKALVIIFFIPLLANIVISLVGDRTDITACYNSAKKPSLTTKYIPAKDEKGKTIYVDPLEYEKGHAQTLNFDCKSKIIKAELSCETLKIVEQHYMDFNSTTFKSYIQQQGGFENYVQSLGGVFQEFYGKKPKVTTVAEFQRVAEYVLGFLTMYGVDYYNGKNSLRSHYCKWGGDCLYYNDGGGNPIGTADAFYPGRTRHDNNGLSDSEHFDKMVSNLDNPNITTNCNYLVDMVYIKAGIFTPSLKSDKFITMAKKTKVVTNFADLKVGDLIHFFREPVDSSNPESWRDRGWGHVAFVGEVYPEQHKAVVYDGGQYFTRNQNYKWTIDTSKTTSGLHGYKGWGAIHYVDLA